LRTHFEQWGRLVDAVVMTKNWRPRGFGFVTYESPEQATQAVQEVHKLDGRVVDVKRAVLGDRETDEQASKIFVGGLPQEATATDLRERFKTYGQIAEVKVMLDRRTKRSRCFGFVRFVSGVAGETAAGQVLAEVAAARNPKASHKIKEKWVEVKRATPACFLEEQSPCGSSDVSTAPCTPCTPMAQVLWDDALGCWSGYHGSSLGAFGADQGLRRQLMMDDCVEEGESPFFNASPYSVWPGWSPAAALSPFGVGNLDAFSSPLAFHEEQFRQLLASTAEASPADDKESLPPAATRSVTPPPGLAKKAVAQPPGLGLSSPMKVELRGGHGLAQQPFFKLSYQALGGC